MSAVLAVSATGAFGHLGENRPETGPAAHIACPSPVASWRRRRLETN